MKRGIYHYERGVALGDSASLYVCTVNDPIDLQRMGMLRLLGQKGYPVNYPEAVKFLHQSAGAADLDAPQGAYVLALLLAGEFNGVNIPENILPHDDRLARRMLEKASSLGFSHAQQKLGSAYENGTGGCGYDPVLSLHYYSLAAKQGDPEANMGLSKWYLCGAEGFTANEEKAFIYAERAAKKGLPQAEFAMGMTSLVSDCRIFL
jgi:TPR repeat protein